MDITSLLIGLTIGAVAGGAAVWAALRAKAEAARAAARAEAEAARLSGRAEVETALSEAQAGRAAVEASLRARDEELARAAQEHARAAADLAAAREQLRLESERRATAEAQLESERRQTAEKLALLNDAQQKLSDAFRALSAEALKLNNQQFMDLAKTTFEMHHKAAAGDLEKRQTAIDELVRPLRESLQKVEAEWKAMEQRRAQAHGELSTTIQQLASAHDTLRKETANLVTALRAPNVRGRWGELQLRRVAEMAGMIEYCDFITQESVAVEGGRLRPDMVVRLPNERRVVVDAKTPLLAYLEALEAPTGDQRAERLRAFAQHVRDHIARLSQKAYWDQFTPAPEFVVMFLPAETFYSAALEQDARLIELGVEQKVLLATPTTLIALLRAVAYGWRQERMAANAEQISALGRDLYERIRKLGEHFDGLRGGLQRAVEAYNRAAGALETRVLVQARRFKELGASTGADLELVEPLDTNPRSLSAAELRSAADSEVRSSRNERPAL